MHEKTLDFEIGAIVRLTRTLHPLPGKDSRPITAGTMGVVLAETSPGLWRVDFAGAGIRIIPGAALEVSRAGWTPAVLNRQPLWSFWDMWAEAEQELAHLKRKRATR